VKRDQVIGCPFWVPFCTLKDIILQGIKASCQSSAVLYADKKEHINKIDFCIMHTFFFYLPKRRSKKTAPQLCRPPEADALRFSLLPGR